MSSQVQNLSRYDAKTLEYVLGGLPGTPSLSSRVDYDLPDNDSHRLPEDLRLTEKSAVALAESGDLKQALKLLDKVIEAAPYYGAAYNNKAQVLRMQVSQNPKNVTAVSEAITLLDKAIELEGSNSEKVSPRQAAILRGALLQKAALLMMTYHETPEHIGWDAWTRDQLISDSLRLAGEYGDSTAAQMAPSYNPYAKLCGSMVQQALRQTYPDAF